MIEFFEPMIPPNTTHNAMEIRKRGDKTFLGKSEALLDAEIKWEAHLGQFAPEKPLTGPLRADLRLCWPTDCKHYQGEPKDTKPDLDNVEKTFWDVCERLGYYKGDQQVVAKQVSKCWADPAGVYLRLEEI